MKTWIIGAAVAGLTCAPLAVIGINLMSNVAARHPDREQLGDYGSEGNRRNDLLAELTVKFVSEGRLVTNAMRRGGELAPIAFLNAELERAGEKWRVTSIDGIKVETIGVS